MSLKIEISEDFHSDYKELTVKLDETENKIQFLLDPEIKINRQQTNDLEFDIKTCVNLVSFINSIQA